MRKKKTKAWGMPYFKQLLMSANPPIYFAYPLANHRLKLISGESVRQSADRSLTMSHLMSSSFAVPQIFLTYSSPVNFHPNYTPYIIDF